VVRVFTLAEVPHDATFATLMQELFDKKKACV
jgi:hypothetical protein